MSEAIQLYDKIADPLAAIDRLGEVFAKSGMFGAEKVEQGKVLALACLCERKTPFEILRTYHLQSGKLSMRSDAMLAEYRLRGGLCKWLSALGDCAEAKAHFTYKENDSDFSYTAEDAKREQLLGKDTYKKATPDMLRARLVTKVLRAIAPEVVAGVYLPDERPDDAPAPQVQVAPLFVEPVVDGKPAVKPEPKPEPAPVIEAEVVTEPVPPAPAPVPVEDSPDLAALKLTLAGCEDAALKWMREKGWITFEQDFNALQPAQIRKVLDRPEAFVRAVKVNSPIQKP